MKGKKNWNETDKNVLICILYCYIIIFTENSREFRDKLSEEICELPSFKSSNEKLENMKKMPFVISKTISCQIISLTLKCTSI